jgi:N-acetylmuramic acid 6-phosphate etherase
MTHDLDHLLTEQRNDKTAALDAMDTYEMLRVINDEDKRVAYAVEKELPNIAAAVDNIVAALTDGGRLVYMGAGTSGRLAVLDAAECPPTFGTDPGMVVGLIAGGEKALIQAVEGAEDQTVEAVEQLKAIGFTGGDVLVGVAASGRTPYVLAGLEYANSLGAYTVAICCSPDSAVGKAASLAITPLAGPEVITGSTRLKAGTATKMVLNMLSTAAMVRLGKVYGNLMVDVRPTNVKLVERAKRIVAEAAGVSREKAGQALESAGWNAKTAIVMLKCGCSPDEADKRLGKACGFIHKAIADS